ncbi:MAG: phosphotransferase [Christensenellaceae bacterium]|jgi:thiamine kinase-like enzyme|nr:phosphotransferase [Christensenellaceae bacterium]
MARELIASRVGKEIFRDGDKIYKVFSAAKYSKADILNEALNHSRVEETDLLVPSLLDISHDDTTRTIILDYVDGKTLQELMEENPKKTAKYLEMFVDLQILMHSKSNPKLGRLRDKMHTKVTNSGIEATIRYELHIRIDNQSKKEKLLHGDFNPSNVILRPDGKLYIIDWSHATQGEPAADAARTYLLFKLEKRDDLAEKYLKLFCTRSDTAKQSVQQWMPIVAASRFGLKIPEEKEFLESWVQIIGT